MFKLCAKAGLRAKKATLSGGFSILWQLLFHVLFWLVFLQTFSRHNQLQKVLHKLKLFLSILGS